MTKTRLSKEDWIAAGFKALRAKGVPALKAESLARDLNTTKGSFYWHFADVPAFQAAMILQWERDAIGALKSHSDHSEGAEARLRQIDEMIPPRLRRIEPAMRAWAQSDPVVRKALREIDQLRLRYVEVALSDLDLPNPQWARAVYGAMIGAADLPGGDSKDPVIALIDLLFALRDL